MKKPILFMLFFFFVMLGISFAVSQLTGMGNIAILKIPILNDITRLPVVKKTEEGRAVLEGSLGNYFSKYLSSTIVCVVEVATDREICTKDLIVLDSLKKPFLAGFRIQLPEGKYKIYAYVENDKENKIFYVDKFVCEDIDNCLEQAAQTVELKDKSFVRGILIQERES